MAERNLTLDELMARIGRLYLSWQLAVDEVALLKKENAAFRDEFKRLHEEIEAAKPAAKPKKGD